MWLWTAFASLSRWRQERRKLRLAQPPPPRPSRTLFFWLLGTFLLTFLPQVADLPAWIVVVVIGALIARAVLEIARLPLPSIFFTSTLAFFLFIAIGLEYHSFIGHEPTTSFMAGLLTLKFYELRGPRDVSVVIFASLFIVVSALLYSQSLELFIYCLIMMWVLAATLLRNALGDRPDNELLPMLWQAGFILVQAVPLGIFLFFFFPRSGHKLQILLHDTPVGITDRVSPGTVERLAGNDSLAMYVKFIDSSIPAPEMMYWRGLVLWDYHGGEWTVGRTMAGASILPPRRHPDSVRYTQEITIQPNNQPWLFALDYPFTPATNGDPTEIWTESMIYRGDVLQVAPNQGRIDHTERYRVTSASQLEALKTPLPRFERNAALQLPDGDDIDPRVRALADTLHQAAPEPEAYVAAVLRYLHQPGFVYTTAPGMAPPGKDWLAYFLFTTKAGYCEHFASAFAVLMRLGGVPTRLVVGYQGATFNPDANTYVVLQSNAHTWDEVWLESTKRWMRIDPTAALPPGFNTTTGNESAQSQQDEAPMLHRPEGFAETYLPAWANRALTEMEMRRQQIEVSWDDWVFSYNPDTQRSFANRMHLGMEGLAGLSVLAVALCYFLFRRFMRRRVVLTPVESLYAKFCRGMAQRGVPRANWEGPLAYTGRVAETFPEKKEEIHHLGDIIARHRYGPGPDDPATPKELQALLDQIAAAQAATASTSSSSRNDDAA